MDAMSVRPIGGDKYAINIRGHQVRVDQPLDLGGDDTAPTPTELFVAGLGSCVAFYAGRFLDRHGIDSTGFGVEVAWRMAKDRPGRVGQITITLAPPNAIPHERLPAFLAVAKGCTVHHSLQQPPAVDISLSHDDKDNSPPL
jgi:putative redox protein